GDALKSFLIESPAGPPLVTLIGAGGCGKTRLACEVAERLIPEFPDGVWLAELAEVREPQRVDQAVAAALGLSEEPGRPLVETLADALRRKTALIVLDNCEHLLAACRALVTGLLRSCPDLRVLATSREALGTG